MDHNVPSHGLDANSPSPELLLAPVLLRKALATLHLPPQPPVVSEVADWGEAMEAARFLMEEEEMTSWLHRGIGNHEELAREICPQLIASASGAPAAGYYTLMEVDQLPPPPPAMELNQSPLALVSQEMGGFEKAPTAVMEELEGSGVIRAAVGKHVGASSSAVIRGLGDADRKRKAKMDEGSRCEGHEFKHLVERKDSHRLTKKTRTAEIHNLTERKRRGRINAKMKILQQMIPRCNKSDICSMLDETITYLKSLQSQIKMMANGCNIGPMMHHDVQTNMTQMDVHMGMKKAMSPDMVANDITTPMMSFMPVIYHPLMQPPLAHILSKVPLCRSSNIITSDRPPIAHLLPRVPLYHLSNISISDQFNAQASHIHDLASNSANMQGPNVPQIPNVTNMYHGYSDTHRIQNRSMDRAMKEPKTHNKGPASTKKFSSG